MKRIIKGVIILGAIWIMTYAKTSIYATEYNTNTPSAKSEITINNVGENQIQVTVSVNDLVNIGEGINAYIGVLEYNANELEFVEFININNWNNPTYKILDNELKVVSTSNKFLKEDNIIFKAVFNKKVSKDIYDFKISKLELAAKVNNETLKVIANTENSENIVPVAINNSLKIIIVCLVTIVAIVIIYMIYKEVKRRKIR